MLSDFFQTKDRVAERTVFNYGEHGFYEREDGLEIPKIDISAPLIFARSGDKKEIEASLDLGVVHFFDSALPGEIGETVILGHSAPPGWPKIKYDWVFSRINELENGDEIIFFFDNKKFNYFVTNKFFLEKGEEIPEYSASSENVLILISCWPPGKDVKRIAVEARMK